MQIISMLAQKGGVGKTTLAQHLAIEAERAGYRVAVVDIDPQESLTKWGQRRDAETPTVLKTGSDRLEEALTACRESGIELAIIDTLPRVERPATVAARVSDLAVIPCGPSAMDMEAIGGTLKITEALDRAAVIVLNRARPGSRVNEKAQGVLTEYGVPVCPHVVFNRAVFQDAGIDGRTAQEVEPRGKGTADIGPVWSWIARQLTTVGGNGHGQA